MKLIQECTLTPFSHIQPWIFDEILVLDHLQRIAQLIDFKFWMAVPLKNVCILVSLKDYLSIIEKVGFRLIPCSPFADIHHRPSEGNILHLRKILKFLTTNISGNICLRTLSSILEKFSNFWQHIFLEPFDFRRQWNRIVLLFITLTFAHIWWNHSI